MNKIKINYEYKRANNMVGNNQAIRVEMKLEFISIFYNIYVHKLNHA